MQNPLVSIIIPIYNEENQIIETIDAIHNILVKTKTQFELILVDDGSIDGTWGVIKDASTKYPNIHAIKLSRNFGKECALSAGLSVAKGNACITIDADLQHPPTLIPEMIKLWQNDGFDIVECIKINRGKEKKLIKFGANFFYKLLNKSSGFNLKMSSDFKLLDEKVVAAWKEMPEHNTFFRGMSLWVGFKRTSIPFTVQDRVHGKTKWSFIKLLGLATNAITSFSALPLHIITFLGVTFLLSAILLGLQTLYMKLTGIAFSGFTTVILLLLIIGSVIMISLGIIGIYIAKIYDEVKRRPRYIVEETLTYRSAG